MWPCRIAHEAEQARLGARTTTTTTTTGEAEGALTESRVPLNCSLEMLSSISSSFFLRGAMAAVGVLRDGPAGWW